jgi:uncharacterized protein (TIGR02996 family)
MTNPDLLRAVLERPDDDSVRLVYADWLDDAGEAERGEFVRVQVELSSMGHDPHSCEREPCPDCPRDIDRWDALRLRERELLKANFWKWTEGLPEALLTRQCPCCAEGVADWETGVIECRRCESTGVIDDDEKVEFSRGFVSAVTLSAADFLAHAAAIFACQPVERVTLADKRPDEVSLGLRWWINSADPNSAEPDVIPEELFDLLPAIDGTRLIYRTEQAALDALSAACVLHGRRLCKLPDLTPKKG